MKIIVDNKIPYLIGALESNAEVMYLPGAEINQKHLRDADALITRTRTKCNAEILDNTSVKFIASATIGYDHIDTGYCDSKNIKWANAPGCNSGSVMQYIAAALVHLSNEFNFQLKDKTIGIVGVGNVGTKISKLAHLLGMKVLLNDLPRARKEGGNEFVDLQTIIDQSDIISLHVPLNKDGEDRTYYMFDNELFNKMSPNTMLINTSRGEVVNNVALKDALKQKKIKAAVLDVWENEPEIDKELLDLIAIGTPHIAGYSKDGKAKGTAMSVQAVSKFFKLGIDNWKPYKIEQVDDNEIIINCSVRGEEAVLKNAIIGTYDIKADDLELRKNIENFEQLRNEYPIRREFHAFILKLLNCRDDIREKCATLGFEVI